ncbi:MAG: PAS domain S-box protein, partial [Candidatus Accumulibacter sp.]|nr:PAS domain S-box protein [Accumulibacter sp.]
SYQGRQAELVLADDITARRRSEQALLESELKYRELVENANSIILRWNPEGQVTFINEFGLQFFGYAEEQLLGRHVVGTIVPPFESSGQDLRALMKDICRSPERFEHNINENIRCGGERVWVAWTNRAIVDASGKVVEVFSVGSDITERKHAEVELQRYREQLEELVAERTAELRQAMAQLLQAEKLAALGNLVAGVAHELNTPLGNARVVASLLSEQFREFSDAVESGSLRRSQVDTLLGRGREAVDLLERNTARAAELIGHFKQVAVDQSSARRRSFDLRQTVEEMLVTLRPSFKSTRHRIELAIAAGLELDSYPGPLEQVIANLVGNSLVHGFAGIDEGRIEIEAHALDDDRVVLRYSDNGVGIAEATLNRIFEPFFTTRLGQGGSGLGLYIVYNLVNAVLGGTIEVESAPSAGTTFTLTLPRSAPDRSSAG